MKRYGLLIIGIGFFMVSMQASAGTITGVLDFKGPVPAADEFIITKNPKICGTGMRAVTWVRVKNGKLAQAVVAIDKVPGGTKVWPTGAVNAKSNQKGCTFIPYLQVIKNGGELTVLNSDPVLHNIHTYEIIGRAKRTMFNVSQPGKGFVFKEKIKVRRGHWMKVECDAHNFMQAWDFIARSPYYSVSGNNGVFKITDIPPGTYNVVAYHPTLGMLKKTVKVGAATTTVDFTFSAK